MATEKMENVREVSDLSILVVTSTAGVSQRLRARSSARVHHGVVMNNNKEGLSTPEPGPLTYHALLQAITDQAWGDAPRDGPAPNVVRNARTQLNAWLRFLGKELTDDIGTDFGADFERNLQAFVDAQTHAGRRPSSVRDRKYAISRARSACILLATSALPRMFAAALDVLIDASGLPCNEIARRAGVSPTTLGMWRRGSVTPNTRQNNVAELEKVLRCAPGTLTARLPRTLLPTNVEVYEAAPSTPFREHMRELQREPHYVLKYVTEQLRKEWSAFVTYKTTPLPELDRHERAQWRAKPEGMCRVLSPRWCCEVPGGRIVPSAHIAWTRISHYLGWLTLPEEDGGAGIGLDEAQTMAWLAIPELMERFIRWSAERCGAFNSSTLSYLNTACSLLSPTTGYLTQCEWLNERLPAQWRAPDGWRKHCDAAYRHLNALRLKLSASIRMTRDPEWAIRDIVSRPDPLTPLLQMLDRMEQAMPALSAPHDRAVMMRDIAFVALLVSNPLRITQYMTAQCGPGTEENVFKDATGTWCMRFAAEHIKNAKYRPKRQRSRVYEVKVAAWVVPLLERYLQHARPSLLKGKRSPYLLVGQLGRHTDMKLPFSNVDDRLQLLTARYIPGSPGFRGNGFRHIVATAWLKAHPRDYLTVARMLNDKLETVIDAYSHLEISDCLDDYDEWVRTLLRKS